MSLIQTLTKGTTDTSQSTSLAGTWSSNTTTGNTIIIAVAATATATNSITSVTDSQSNTYTRVTSILSDTGAAVDVELWYSYNITGGTTPTITINYGLADNAAFIAREYSQVVTASNPLDVSHTQQQTGVTSQSSGTSAALAQIAEILIGVSGVNGDSSPGYSAGSGYSHLATASGTSAGNPLALAMEDGSPSSTSGQAATFTSIDSIDTGTIIATFKITNPTISVSDSSTVTNVITQILFTNNENVFDQSAVTENFTVLLPVMIEERSEDTFAGSNGWVQGVKIITL